jgi:hypothetical protein
MKVGDLVRKHTGVWANMEPWNSHGLLAIGIVIGPSKTSDLTILWAGKYRTYEQRKNLEVVQERK